MFFKASLLFLDRGHMRVAEHRNAVRIDLDESIERLLKRRPCLFRQAVNQVRVNAFEAQRPRFVQQPACLFIWLDTAHDQLYGRIKILDSNAEPVESHLSQRSQVSADRSVADIEICHELFGDVTAESDDGADVQVLRR